MPPDARGRRRAVLGRGGPAWRQGRDRRV